MATTTVSSREFNQDRAKVKKATESGPVIVTDRGKPVLVVLKYEEYERIKLPRRSIAEALYMPGAGEIEIEFPRSREKARGASFD
jgi:prevent-host-death family protein